MCRCAEVQAPSRHSKPSSAGWRALPLGSPGWVLSSSLISICKLVSPLWTESSVRARARAFNAALRACHPNQITTKWTRDTEQFHSGLGASSLDEDERNQDCGQSMLRDGLISDGTDGRVIHDTMARNRMGVHASRGARKDFAHYNSTGLQHPPCN